ncbi:glycosyl hydrolase family 47 protein, partial [Metarhizium majus ARSEF 297]
MFVTAALRRDITVTVLVVFAFWQLRYVAYPEPPTHMGRLKHWMNDAAPKRRVQHVASSFDWSRCTDTASVCARRLGERRGAWPMGISMRDEGVVGGDGFTLGAGEDSLFEHLPKMHQLLRGGEDKCLAMAGAFLDTAWDMFTAINNGTSTDYANAAMLDVTVARYPLPKMDYMETVTAQLITNPTTLL